MRPILEYSLRDWLHLRPLLHAHKTLRYRVVDRIYRRQPAKFGAVQSILSLMRRRKVLVTIAYRDPETIAWQAALVRQYVPNALYIIADNSPDDTSSQAIARIAEDQGIPYLRLPTNAWNKGSRSHGLALNWVWYNLVRPGEPEAVGFLDHDLFPTAADDPFAPLGTQDFFGAVRTGGPRWYLWAGFCMFKFDRMRDKPLDFGQDWFNGLDTGGGNWRVLYQHVDRHQMQELALVSIPYTRRISSTGQPMQWCGRWLHEVGTMSEDEWQAEKRQMIADMLAPHLARAGFTKAPE